MTIRQSSGAPLANVASGRRAGRYRWYGEASVSTLAAATGVRLRRHARPGVSRRRHGA